MIRVEFNLFGVVQGIGLRPLLYRLSQKYHLSGFTKNTESMTLLLWQGTSVALWQAYAELESTLSTYGSLYSTQKKHSCIDESDFSILESTGFSSQNHLICPDLSLCPFCKASMQDPQNRRFGYSFISCTLCGPRASICRQLPYDRVNTSMGDFPLCADCLEEYGNPQHPLFHAQTLSCSHCGPKAWLTDNQGNRLVKYNNTLEHAANLLSEGKILAVKGISGFHIMCLASRDEVALELRRRKKRMDKPFAILCLDGEQSRQLCELSSQEEEALLHFSAPIVLAKRTEHSRKVLSDWVAPNQDYLGVMIASNPLYYQLVQLMEQPLIATSANLSGQPICFTNEQAKIQLKFIVDGFLLHNRVIVNPAEDSIVKVIANKKRTLRLGRGLTPWYQHTSSHIATDPLLGLGSHQKNNLSFYKKNLIQVFPQLGNLNSREVTQRRQSQLHQLMNLTPQMTALSESGSHIDFCFSKDAPKHNNSSVHHHLAHVYAVIQEHELNTDLIAFSWDGIGIGPNKALWGGEVFLVQEKRVQHSATLEPIALVGLDRAMVEPRRIALALVLALKQDVPKSDLMFQEHFSTNEYNNLVKLFANKQMVQSCSSMGRLFDGVAFLLGGPSIMSYEAQSAMYLEQLAEKGIGIGIEKYPCTFSFKESLLRIEWKDMLHALLHDLSRGKARELIAYQFHDWCSELILLLAQQSAVKTVVLSGGVFQNKVLMESCYEKLESAGYDVYSGEKIPVNDGGLSYGQIGFNLKKAIFTPRSSEA